MTFFSGYNARIISKISLNKLGNAQNHLNYITLKQGIFKVEVKKYSKEFIDLYEVSAILEQMFMQKPRIAFTDVIERATNLKVRDLQLTINLNGVNLDHFFTLFLLYVLSDRKKRNFVEYNNINLKGGSLKFNLSDFKIFRKILWNNVMNITNEISFNFFFTKPTTVLSRYKLYILIKFLLKLFKKREYAKK